MTALGLLLTGLGTTGLMIANLPALAQLSNDTSTFTGEVAQMCSFALQPTMVLGYRSGDNTLMGEQDIELATNLSVIRMSVSSVVIEAEASGSGSATRPLAQLYDMHNGMRLLAAGDKTNSSTSLPMNVNSPQSHPLRLYGNVFTESRGPNGIKYLLAPGTYSYSVTLSCLM